MNFGPRGLVPGIVPDDGDFSRFSGEHTLEFPVGHELHLRSSVADPQTSDAQKSHGSRRIHFSLFGQSCRVNPLKVGRWDKPKSATHPRATEDNPLRCGFDLNPAVLIHTEMLTINRRFQA